MIAELGHFALIMALGFACLGALGPLIGAAKGNKRLMALGSGAAYAQFTASLISFLCLTYLFYISDFSVRVVAANSHTLKPMMYKIAGVWGNHEGSLMLWVLMLSLFAAAVALRGKRLPDTFRARVLGVQCLLAVGFLLFILFTSNPFDRLIPAALEGNGLNPLLQDPGLVFHPPLLYLGYVGLSIAFSFAVAALLEGDVNPAWARWVRPWTLTAWMFLTAGIALGSWWAYYELGWGGWWFWDPVENASFMPWLVATALLHSAIVVEKRGALKSWTILLAIVAFSFSLLGTFLVRSGVITSVHAFASDPARGIFILAFLAIVVGGSLALYAWRVPRLTLGGLFGLTARESALIVNNVLLSTFAAVVLVGTLYPLMLEAYDGSQISVGPPFFNFATIMLVSPLIIALGFGPLLSWKRGHLSKAAIRLLPIFIVALMVFLGTIWATMGNQILTAFGLMLAAWLMGSVLMELAHRIKLFEHPAKALARLLNLPRAHFGMSLAHLGVGLVLLGVTVSEAWTVEKLELMQAGESTDVAGYTFIFNGVEPIVGPNFTAIRGHFDVIKAGRSVANLAPEDRVYAHPVTNTTEASIHPMWHGDLYAVIGEAAGGKRFSVRLYYKPFVSFLWLGAMLMCVGGLLSLSDRRLRLGAAS